MAGEGLINETLFNIFMQLDLISHQMSELFIKFGILASMSEDRPTAVKKCQEMLHVIFLGCICLQGSYFKLKICVKSAPFECELMEHFVQIPSLCVYLWKLYKYHSGSSRGTLCTDFFFVGVLNCLCLQFSTP